MQLLVLPVDMRNQRLAEPLWLAFGAAALAALVNICSAVAMLQGMRWGRTLYIVYTPSAVLGIGLLTGWFGAFNAGEWTIFLISSGLLRRGGVSDYLRGELAKVTDTVDPPS